MMKRFSDKIQNFRKASTSPEKTVNRLMQIYLDLEGSTEFPFTLALNAFEKIQTDVKTQEELLQYLLEDILVSSLYATFYEEIFHTIHENPDVAVPLVNRFSEDQATRERIIAEQAESHLAYILRGGKCPGCGHCENHHDVTDLVSYWQNQDFKFFVTLYMGMQTIQYTMEYVLYDVIPTCQDYVEDVSRQNILELRQALYEFVEHKLNL